MTLQQFKYALAVQEELSFVKAAQKCNVSQPSLSTQIKILESEFGIIFFNRAANSKVQVTPQGKIILGRLKKLTSELDQIVDDAKSFESTPTGTLKIGIIPTICPYIMPLLLKYKNKLYPHLNLEIAEETTDSLLVLLSEGRLDCGILSTPKKAPENLFEKFLYYEPFMFYAASDHPLLEKDVVSSKDLSEFPAAMLDEAHCMSDQVLTACQLKRSSLPSDQSKLISGGLQTLVSIVDETNSFSLIPKLATEYLHLKHPKSGLRDIVDPTPQRKVSLIYNKNYGRKVLINAVADSILKGLPDTLCTRVEKSALIIDPSKDRFRKV